MMQVVMVCSLCPRLVLDTVRQNEDYSCLQLFIYISHLLTSKKWHVFLLPRSGLFYVLLCISEFCILQEKLGAEDSSNPPSSQTQTWAHVSAGTRNGFCCSSTCRLWSELKPWPWPWDSVRSCTSLWAPSDSEAFEFWVIVSVCSSVSRAS